MSEVETNETEVPTTDIKEILTRVAQLEQMSRENREEIAFAKKQAFDMLKEQKSGIVWTKAGLREAFRLAKMEKGERDVMLTQASSILRDSGLGEIDLHTFI